MELTYQKLEKHCKWGSSFGRGYVTYTCPQTKYKITVSYLMDYNTRKQIQDILVEGANNYYKEKGISEVKGL